MQLEDFLPHLHGAGLYPSSPYPDRRINSVYNDTVDFPDYMDNISGIGVRCKTRIRWYNGDLSKLTLEQKIKAGKAPRKETERLTNKNLAEPHTKNGLREILAENDTTLETLKMAPLFPVLEVQYDRQYFMLDTDLRMTIDLRQKFKRLHPAPVSSFVNFPVYAVVEFKYPAPERLRVQAMIQCLPFRIFRHSKYVIGLESTAP
ncbi:MAG: VTC domain-containing protein [Henriciella sp.]|nr:VTC domain-containing protein [Henriciella sp.]